MTRARPAGRRPSRPAYLGRLDPAVRPHFAKATDLRSFLATVPALTPRQRKVLARQALILIEQNYVHLPLKRAMHAVDPVQRLKLLLQALEQGAATTQPAGAEFHREMTEIFTSVRDLHTNYLLPAPINEVTAFLPFMVEDCFEGEQRRYLVTHVTPGFGHRTFRPGVEVVYWSGVPIERAVLNEANRYAGSNAEARHARGVETLTTRALMISLPPDEEWVIVGYRTPAGQMHELRFDWLSNPPLPAGSAEAGDADDPAGMATLGLDLEQHLIQRARKALFAPHVVAAQKTAARKQARGVTLGDLESAMPDVFEARSLTTPSGTFGYLRIRTFAVQPADAFVAEFIRLLSALPRNGLIIDVRGNGGGYIVNGERILQTLTPRRIEPERFQFVNTSLNLQICRRNGPTSSFKDLSAWVDSMEHALQTGETFSAAFPVTDPDACNALGQKYFGPVVLITDALCYSTTDIFAAGFQDHEIGPVLGADGNTGAGGANVWDHEALGRDVLPGSVYRPLPRGANMRVAMRRSLRVGRRAGTVLEDLGVIPDARHFMTRDDVLHGNVDLINRAGAMLARLPVRKLEVTVAAPSPTATTLTVTTRGIRRIDAYLAGRPIQSVDVRRGRAVVSVPRTPTAPKTLELQGFDRGRLVARYRTTS